jgi:nucleoside-diphosphate-sugar epimerase
MTCSLVIGALGQLGRELATSLAHQDEAEEVVMADLAATAPSGVQLPYVQLDVLDTLSLCDVVAHFRIDTVFLLAATLSASGELKPQEAWRLNMTGLLNVLDLAAAKRLRVFWPSSISVFGPSSPKHETPQSGPTEPATVYGISKLAGEGWCAWYRANKGVDVRSVRYPGVVGHVAAPGDSTTDYATEVFHAALEGSHYTSFLASDTRLPMMYMPDAIRAAIELMNAPAHMLRCQSAYNVAGTAFTPADIVTEIRRTVPDLRVSYVPDQRQTIAASWPASVDDERARVEWGWRPRYDLAAMVTDMLVRLQRQKNASQLPGHVDLWSTPV